MQPSTKLGTWMSDNGKRDEDLAPLLGRDRSVVSRLRRGELRPTHELMEKIAEVTGGKVLPNDWFDTLPAKRVA